MTRLIVISNRVQAPEGSHSGAQGGLAVALQSALQEYRGIWFGWSGDSTEQFTGHINFQRSEGVTTATVDLEEQDIEEYYNGYANRTLWPLFHYRIDLAEFERGFADGYHRANVRFAETVRPLVEPDDVIWVQDYHMIPLGDELRRLGCANRMGFFLHIPWPPRRLLSALPEAEALVRSLFAYDVIGFHTEEWLESFREYVEGELGATWGGDGTVTLGDRRVLAITCPIGIDAAEFAAMANEPSAQAITSRMRESANGRSLIVGVDRLDYSKGLEERFLGYERFLREHPDQHKHVILVQVAPPSRASVDAYRSIRSTLEGLAGRINGAYADLDWVPIRYVNRGYPRDALAGLYRAARVGLVTPLRDGMNLVAKEFVAAQNPQNPGVLVLSRFAGAAEQFKDSAVLVNPFSPEEISDAVARALAMDREERVRRWKAMMDNVLEEDVFWWSRRFLASLMDGHSGGQAEVDRADLATGHEG